MVIGKKGQFFLLAAVIISAIIMGFAYNVNEARTNNEPDNFRELSYDIKRETGAVIDYQIYSGFSEDDDLKEFVDLIAQEVRDKYFSEDQNSNLDFVFIYGNSSNVTIRNYADTSATINGDNRVEGSSTPITSVITTGETSQEVEAELKDYDENGDYSMTSIADVTEVKVEIEGEVYSFPVSSYKQVIFIIQKGEGDEKYISAG